MQEQLFELAEVSCFYTADCYTEKYLTGHGPGRISHRKQINQPTNQAINQPLF